MSHQVRLWSDPRVIAERLEPAEAVLGRAMELPTTYVYRYPGPNYGKRCTIVAVKPSERTASGRTIVHIGEESLLVRFEDGARGVVLRRQILREGGLQARQVLAKKEARS